MGTCWCERCREERERQGFDRPTAGDFLGVVALVLIFIVLLVFLPIGEW